MPDADWSTVPLGTDYDIFLARITVSKGTQIDASVRAPGPEEDLIASVGQNLSNQALELIIIVVTKGINFLL
jgi:hypothetical protein